MEQFPQKNNNQEKIEFNSWKKVNPQEEGGEFERVFKEFYNQELQDNQKLIDFIINNYESSEPIILNNDLWAQLDNSDSYYFNTGEWLEMAQKMESHDRDWQSIKSGYENGLDVDLPIIAKLPNGIFHLISGNTRLSVARVMDILPQVIVIDFPVEDFQK